MQEKTIGRPKRDPFETLVNVLVEASQYDFLLGVVPVVFTVALVTAHVLSLPVVHTMFVAATIGMLVIIDACYRNPPSTRDRCSSTDHQPFPAVDGLCRGRIVLTPATRPPISARL